MPRDQKNEAIELVGSLLADIALLEAAEIILSRVSLPEVVDEAKGMISLCQRRITMLRAAYVRACSAVK